MKFSVKSTMGLWFLMTAMAWPTGCGWMPSTDPEEDQLPLVVSPVVEAVPESPLWQEAHSDPPAPEPAPHHQPTTNPLVHIVKWKRETLFSISRWYTGSGNNWKRLATANPDINAFRIHIGDKIMIPEKLLIQRKPLPPDILKPISVRKSASPIQSPKPPPQNQETLLYGPIENHTPAKTEAGNDLPVPLETID